ncbi:hypothetical protein GQX74_004392 [Glossina fuscipes]|nr:hypothetical protein GQX74_004392 [Glossina fuscipes]
MGLVSKSPNVGGKENGSKACEASVVLGSWVVVCKNGGKVSEMKSKATILPLLLPLFTVPFIMPSKSIFVPVLTVAKPIALLLVKLRPTTGTPPTPTVPTPALALAAVRVLALIKPI